MGLYEDQMKAELAVWQAEMKKSPSFVNRISKDLQVRINRVIPEKVHKVITSAIETMTRGVLTGAGFTTSAGVEGLDLPAREANVMEKIKFYTNASTAEGAITGAGGILLGLADFPIWLTLKMKMLFEIAAQYGYSVDDYKERVFILYIFQITFSSQAQRQKLYAQMERWEQFKNELPASIDDFDWRTFQQEYRDYIDIAKLLQLIPGIGAAVGAYVNHRLTEKLGHNAMQAYRMRVLQ
jgi:proteasome assembly chaperone (PAC2) family protein